jgi:hypothetical protein
MGRVGGSVNGRVERVGRVRQLIYSIVWQNVIDVSEEHAAPSSRHKAVFTKVTILTVSSAEPIHMPTSCYDKF